MVLYGLSGLPILQLVREDDVRHQVVLGKNTSAGSLLELCLSLLVEEILRLATESHSPAVGALRCMYLLLCCLGLAIEQNAARTTHGPFWT